MPKSVKKSFNSRLSWWEKQVQKAPIFPFVAFIVVAIVCLTIWVNEGVIPVSWKSIVGILLDNADTISIVAAAALYYKEAPSRKERRHYEAWQVIDSSHGVETSFARCKALQDLNDDGVSLSRLNLEGASLDGIRLNGASLERAKLNGAKLHHAQLNGAKLGGVKFNGAKLFMAQFDGAELGIAQFNEAKLNGASFNDAKLHHAQFNGAKLNGAKFNGANLNGASLVGTNLSGAKLNGANLVNADLSGANLINADLRNADLRKANLRNIDFDQLTTMWPDKAFFADAKNIPDNLKKQLGIEEDENVPLIDPQ